MSKLQTIIKEKQNRYKQHGITEVFKKEDGAIDLASIMVGVIVIGLIGGVIAATVFAVIPWSQDNAAKQQLDSIVQAENAYFGLSSATPSPLPAGTPANSFGKSAELQTANLLTSGLRYCVTTPDDKKSYTGYSQSSSGTIFMVTDKNSKPNVFTPPSGMTATDALPADCQFITVGVTTPVVTASPTVSPTPTVSATPTPYVDPTPKKFILTYVCDKTTYVRPPITRGSPVGTGTWSDGTTSTSSGIPAGMTLNAGTKYTYTWDGTFPYIDSTYDSYASAGAPCIRSVDHWGTGTNTLYADNAFSGATNLTSIPANISSSILTMSNMFKGATNFNDANVKNWDVSKVTNMSSMFSGASSFNQDLSSWNTGLVTDMSFMFNGATSMNTPLNSWNTGKVVNMNSMFYGATAFNQPLANWNTSNVTNMLLMFYGTSYNQSLTSWDMSKVNKMAFMVTDPDSSILPRTSHPTMFRLTYQCDTTIMVTPPITRGSPSGNATWNDGTTSSIAGAKTLNAGIKYTFIFEGTFTFLDSSYDANSRAGAACIRSLDTWGTATNAVYADNGLIGAMNLTSVPANIPSTVTSMSYMFKGATKFNDPDVKTWDVSRITNMSYMFYGASAFNQDLSSWNTGLVTDMSYMFSGATSMNGNLGSWNTIKVINMNSMFYGATAFNQPLTNWNTSNVTNMLLMFYGTSYNQSLTSWDMSKVNKMAFMVTDPDSSLLPRTSHPNMFRLTYQCDTTTAVTPPITRGSPSGNATWNDGITTGIVGSKTLSAGIKYTFIFEGTFTFLDSTYGAGASCIRSLDTWGTATNAVYADNGFKGAINLTNVPANIPSTVTSMSYMFSGATKFNDPNIRNWNVSKVTNMSYMFQNATSFNQDLKSSWNTAAVTNGTFFAPASFPDAYMPANTSK